MKVHVRRKQYRLALKRKAEAGQINTADGLWRDRLTSGASSMVRDFYPQQSGKGKSK